MSAFSVDDEEMAITVPFGGGRLHLIIDSPVSSYLAPEEWSEWYFIGVDEAVNSAEGTHRHSQDATSDTWRLSIHSIPWTDEDESSMLSGEQAQPVHQEDIGTPPTDGEDWMHTDSAVTFDPNRYQKYYVWACRGTVSEITEQVQVAFSSDPPVTEKYIGSLLNRTNAAEQLAFLEVYLPGETQSIQRAIARQVLHEIDHHDPDVYVGRQKLDVHQFNDDTIGYPEPPLPPNSPHGWPRQDDAMLQTFVGTQPEAFVSEYGRMFYRELDIEFLSIRMAQSIHLSLSLTEVAEAMHMREQLRAMDGA